MTKGKNPSTAATVLIESPVMAPKPDTYSTRHVEVGALSNEQAIALAHVFNGLMKERVQLKSGRFVQTAADAMRYLLEQVYNELSL